MDEKLDQKHRHFPKKYPTAFKQNRLILQNTDFGLRVGPQAFTAADWLIDWDLSAETRTTSGELLAATPLFFEAHKHYLPPLEKLLTGTSLLPKCAQRTTVSQLLSKQW